MQRWMFLTSLRPRMDFELASAGRPLDQTELNKLPGVTIFTNAGQYRARMADDLFGMDSDAYDNLTELLKQLRKPKLGERLNPTSLEQTMREALPPLASHEIERLADGWDRLEQLRTGLEATKEAAREIAGFVRYSWRPWATAVVRRRADRLTRATSELDRTTVLRKNADEALETASAEVIRVTDELAVAKADHTDHSTEHRELLESNAYRDAVAAAGRVEGLKREYTTLHRQVVSARGRQEKQVAAVEREHGKVLAAEREVESAVLRQTQRRGAVLFAATEIGLADLVDPRLTPGEITRHGWSSIAIASASAATRFSGTPSTGHGWRRRGWPGVPRIGVASSLMRSRVKGTRRPRRSMLWSGCA